MLLIFQPNLSWESGDTSGSGDIHNIVGAFSVSTFSYIDSTFPPTIPGLEYTLRTNRCHFTMPDNKVHYTLDVNKLHFTLPDDD